MHAERWTLELVDMHLNATWRKLPLITLCNYSDAPVNSPALYQFWLIKVVEELSNLNKIVFVTQTLFPTDLLHKSHNAQVP